jgi:hypothetical protein
MKQAYNYNLFFELNERSVDFYALFYGKEE